MESIISGIKSIGNGIKNTDWDRVGYMVTGAIVAGFMAFITAGLVLGALSIFVVLSPALIIGLALCAAGVAIGAGLIGGYNAYERGESYSTLVGGSVAMGMAIGSNPLTYAVYAMYLNRVVWGFLGAYCLYKMGVIHSYSSVLDIALGEEVSLHNGRYTQRVRPWFPGDPHLTGPPDSESNSFLVVLDILGTHQTAVAHDYWCENRKNKKDRYGVLTMAPAAIWTTAGGDWIWL